MAPRPAFRPLAQAARIAARGHPAAPRVATTPLGARGFRATRAAPIKVGDSLPSMDVLMETTPGNRVDLAKDVETYKDALVIGVPAAFSGACSSTHIPSYIRHPAIKDCGLVAVVSVNDVFVMKAWGETLDPAGDSGIRFLADPTGKFTQALDLSFDGSAIFGGPRSKRYAIVLKDGKVESIAVEPDNTGTSVSMADKVLGKA